MVFEKNICKSLEDYVSVLYNEITSYLASLSNFLQLVLLYRAFQLNISFAFYTTKKHDLNRFEGGIFSRLSAFFRVENMYFFSKVHSNILE